MRVDKKRITNPSIRGQIQITLDADGLKEANIDPASEVNVIYDKDIISIVREENIEIFFRNKILEIKGER